MKKVAVVILNWNGRKFLKKFLPSVIKYSQDNCDIIIADNASTDSSIEFLHETYPQIRIIQNLINGGFAKGYNDAFKKVDAEYYVLLRNKYNYSPILVYQQSTETQSLDAYKSNNCFFFASNSASVIAPISFNSFNCFKASKGIEEVVPSEFPDAF